MTTRAPRRDNLPAERARSRARVVRLADVQPERVQWLWPGRVPAGMITLLDGDPALGKSTITIDLAARVTTGTPMPFTADDDSKPGIIGDVVILTAEDHLAATVRPRLDAAGADVLRVHALTGITRAGDPDAPLVLPADVAELETVIMANKARLVIIDPLMAFLDADVDGYRDQDVRRALAPLAKVAEATRAAIIIVRHLRKSAGSALYRGGGSIGIIGAARSALIVAKDPDDEHGRFMAVAKGNLAPPAPTLRWRVVDANGVGRVQWDGVADGVTADDLAAPPIPPSPEDRNQVAQAAAALRELLAAGPVPTQQVEHELKERVGCAQRTMERARRLVGVVSRRERDASGRVVRTLLELPPSHAPGAGGVDLGESAKSAVGHGHPPASPPRHGPLRQASMAEWSGGQAKVAR
jgi:hypothetical protein